MSNQHATTSRTDSQDSVAEDTAEKFPGQHAWEFNRQALAAKAQAKAERQAAREAALVHARSCLSLPPASPAEVPALVEAIKALGLPGEQYPHLRAANGELVKRNGRYKQKEAFRRQQRAKLLEEISELPADQPLPIALTALAHQMLARRPRGVA